MARGLRGALRRGLAASMVTGLVALGAVALTSPAVATAPASAHTADVRGTAKCVDGQYVVAWTVTNNDNDYDATLDVISVLPEQSKLQLPDEVVAGRSIDGVQVLPPGSNGIKNDDGANVARLTLHAEWKASEKVLKNDITADVVLPPKTCGEQVPPPVVKQPPVVKNPSAGITLSCDDFQIDLINPTRRTLKFTIAFQFDRDKVIYDDFSVRPGKPLTIPDGVVRGDAEGKAAAAKFNQHDDEDFSKLAVAVAVGHDGLAKEEIDYSDCDDESARPAPDENESPSASPPEAVAVAAPSVSPVADDSLPVTGASLTALLAGAVLVLGAGVGMVVFTRRRKRV